MTSEREVLRADLLRQLCRELHPLHAEAVATALLKMLDQASERRDHIQKARAEHPSRDRVGRPADALLRDFEGRLMEALPGHGVRPLASSRSSVAAQIIQRLSAALGVHTNDAANATRRATARLSTLQWLEGQVSKGVRPQPVGKPSRRRKP